MGARRRLAASGLSIASLLAMTLPAFGANCAIGTTGVAFGAYAVFATAPLDSTGSITYSCNGNASITVSLDKGGAATFDPRRMLKGREALNYNLYLNATRTTIWGDGTGGTQVHSRANLPNNTSFTVTIYGRVPARQDVSAGSYSNTITATINF